MNLPNKLTMFRIILIPFFLICLYMENPAARIAALVIFCAASLTDWADGYIARKYNLVTNFGKFMDPLADKLLVCSAMIALASVSSAVMLPSWVVIIIIAREFMITGFRTLAAEQNVVIAAGFWGKLKTVSQMIMIIVLLLNIDNAVFKYISYILIAAAAFLTVISAIDYIVKNKDVLKG
ncbi:MAG: CDP-diacylglycerol--glycerol-3-phosphate 3-phosphatidyltransferase [Firmicutes bacterium]|nr:CDP-diacylglycerol--glycerol-3-phosphate 3-phosphatidyltransferase [Bacillota bacterium]MBQ9605047.1 CDP-diacylglycerol--glycerol-3-phosphate 3-phosphatidyltransferase [Bacillota bacterium]